MHSNPPLLLALVALAVFAALVPLIRQLVRNRRKTPALYEAVPALLTPAERSFFGVLHEALPSEHLLFAKVRLADLIRPTRLLPNGSWGTAFNRIRSKHVDFVICDRRTLHIVGAIELDDSSHAQDSRKKRDACVDDALASAGIPILHVPARHGYSPASLREEILRKFSSPQAARP